MIEKNDEQLFQKVILISYAINICQVEYKHKVNSKVFLSSVYASLIAGLTILTIFNIVQIVIAKLF